MEIQKLCSLLQKIKEQKIILQGGLDNEEQI